MKQQQANVKFKSLQDVAIELLLTNFSAFVSMT